MPAGHFTYSPFTYQGPVLADYACRPDQSRGRLYPEDRAEERSDHQRDRDRILHSGAFRRLKYKTQVFIHHEGDYYRTRLTHSLEVAQIARSLSRSLGLNEDLAEALALSHDFGHTPFGHAGSDALDAAMAPYGGFDHNDQSLRVLTHLERRYAGFDGLNLTWETLEGVAKHNGPVTNPSPTLTDLNDQMALELEREGGGEAQAAAIADDLAYNTHDIDDGLRAGLFSIRDLEEVALLAPILTAVRAAHGDLEDTRLYHEVVRRMVNVLISDVLAETRRRLADCQPHSPDDIRSASGPIVGFSEAMRGQERELKAFLFRRMYRHYMVNRMAGKARRTVADLFTLFMEEPNCLPEDWQPAATRAGESLADEPPQDKTARARLVADYIAGMTDRFAILEHDRLFSPGSWSSA